jgi:thiosulfate reductase cytochrome b subunit
LAEVAVPSDDMEVPAASDGHRRWVRICHWVVVAGFFTLAFSGILILMVYPRLHWGEVGNDLTPSILDLPISGNHRPDDYDVTTQFSTAAGGPVSANRTYDIFNQNGWARSLHFLAAWFLAVTGAIYVIAGFISGHVRGDLLPRLKELAPGVMWRDFKAHLGKQREAIRGGPPYGLLQKFSYFTVIFIALPLMVITGLSMSPAITAALPGLLDVFGGYQSARTIHFFCFAALVLFVIAHIVLVVMTGFRKQLRAMTWGK